MPFSTNLASLAVLSVVPLAAAQPTITYLASSGVSPASQCWNYEGTNPPAPGAGVLDFGSSGSGEYRYYIRTDLGQIDFAARATISLRVQVVSGAYSANPCGAGQRAGVGFAVADSQGRHLNVGLGADRVYIGTENNPFPGANNPAAPFAWGGLMREVRLEVNALTFALVIDGQTVLSVSRPDMPVNQTTPNLAMFGGDITACASGHGRFERFAVTAVPAGDGNITLNAQPGPSVLACATSPLVLSVSAASPWPLGYQWRRNGAPLVNGELPGGAVVEGADSTILSILPYTAALDGTYDCIVANSCGSRTTVPTSVTLPAQCGPADLGRQGGVPCYDGVLDNNDFIVFIDFFFSRNPAANQGSQGGEPGADEHFDNNDFVVFIDNFFAGC
ncbi:MAG TPA: GC-type dockerin domain-anchored protein [Phycisphaerales bacterium]|nr:GC-type dockerin domain-anchored protein [Phycisphaerales bacterium]